MDSYLETDRLILRRFTPSDVDHLIALHNDPEVMRFLDGGTPKAGAAIEREYIDRFANDGYWAAIEKPTGTFLGWFGLHPTKGHDPDECELGYRLCRAAWGKGYATEGARALLRKGFAEVGVRRVWAQTMAVNSRSRRVMEKAGLPSLRTFHAAFDDPLPGTEHGEVEYALTRDVWARQMATATQPGDDDRAP